MSRTGCTAGERRDELEQRTGRDELGGLSAEIRAANHLDRLTTEVLEATEEACDHLVWLYETHLTIGRELYVKVSTLRADVHAVLEDRDPAGQGSRIAAAGEGDDRSRVS